MRKVGLLLTICLILAAAPADAQRLFGTIGMGGGAYTSSTLVELDPTTGAVVATIGDVGYLINGMAWEYSTATLWATTSAHDPTFPSGLLTINPASAAGTPIGTGFGLGSGSCVLTAVNSTGQVYSWWDPSQDDLIVFDTVTGLATRVGESGTGTATHSIAFDAADVLWMVDNTIYTVDTTTGAVTNTGNSIGMSLHHGQFNPTTGLFYGVDGAYGPGARNIAVVDVATGSVVDTIPSVDDLHTLAWVEGTFVRPGIPAVSPWGAGLMALLVIVCGALVLRRYV